MLHHVAAAGDRADRIAARLAVDVVPPLVADAPRLVLALDDTPTPRHGSHVQAAGVHHDPTPGPAGGPFVYGHVWVVLGVLAAHPAWGTIALPLLARLYVRQKDLGGIPAEPPAGVPDQAGPGRRVGDLGPGLAGRARPADLGRRPGRTQADVLTPLRAAGVTVVSRLRKDAALWDVPRPRRPGDRGRPRVYGERRIDPAKRAGQTRGWSTGTFTVYGKPAEKRYKSFVATWRPAGGAIRVVLVSEPRGWVAFFCTDPAATPADVLGCVADRFALEIAFRDVKASSGRAARSSAGCGRASGRSTCACGRSP